MAPLSLSNLKYKYAIYIVFFREIIYLKNNRVHVINLEEYNSIGTHRIAFCVNGDNVTYFDNFGVVHIPVEMKNFIENQKYHNKYL